MAKDSGIDVVETPGRIALAPNLDDMVRDATQRGAKEAAAMNKRIITEFLSVTKRVYADEITKDNIYAWHRALAKKDNGIVT